MSGSMAGILVHITGNPAAENVFNSERENNDKKLK